VQEFGHGFGHERWTFAIGPGKAFERAFAHVVDVGVIEGGVVGVFAQVGGALAVDAENQIIASQIGPGGGDGVDVGLGVHIRAMQDDDGGPAFGIAILVADGGAGGVGQ